MRILDVLNMTGSAAWHLAVPHHSRTFIEDFGVMTTRTRRPRIITIDVSTHVTTLMTATARKHLGDSIFRKTSLKAFDGAHPINVNAVKLRISPNLRLISRDAILF